MANFEGRIGFLDVLRGFALLGIPIVNYSTFSRICYESAEQISSWHMINKVLLFLQYLLIDEKFYTIFSVLFGISFSIILKNALARGENGKAKFYRRMFTLMAFGAFHLFCMWFGDILFLYALLGLFLPLFYNLSNRVILSTAAIMLLLPILIDSIFQIIGFDSFAFYNNLFMNALSKNGYTWEDFVIAPVIADNIKDFLYFTLTNSAEQLFQQDRFFKVFALFLIGLYLGKNEIIYKLEEYLPVFKKFFMITMPIALPLSVLYAYESMNSHPFGAFAHTFIYIFSVYPLSFAYMAGLVLLYYRFKDFPLWNFFATAGRMSLSIYIGQTIFGIFIFYGLGLALGGKVELYQSILIAIAVYCIEVLLASLWFKRFNRGPLEAIWRKATN